MYGNGVQIGAQANPQADRQPNQPSDTLFIGGLPQDLTEAVSVVICIVVGLWACNN